MNRRSILALGAATSTLVLASSAVAFAAGTKVTVRIEGRTRVLLAPTTVPTHSGFITKGGAPTGTCPAANAAGALDGATHHRWNAKFYASFGDYLVESVLGDTESGKAYYWGVWLNNRYASAGICELKLHVGDRLLFAVDSIKKHEHPLGIIAPAQAKAGKAFKLKIVSYSDQGKATPVAGGHVRGGGLNAVSDKQGFVPVADGAAAKLTFTATDKGFIRSAATTVEVTK